jgi:hypothetical protein
MGRGDNRNSPKALQRRRQRKLKARIKARRTAAMKKKK